MRNKRLLFLHGIRLPLVHSIIPLTVAIYLLFCLPPTTAQQFRLPKDFGALQGGGNRLAAVGDFNNDGIDDVVTAGGSVLLGNGDGTFRSHVDYAIGSSFSQGSPFSVAIADFNGDGNKDIVISGQGVFTGMVSVLLGNGDGTFQPRRDFATGENPYSLAVADFNGDGKADLVTANLVSFGNGTVSVLLGNGDGTFQPHADIVVGLGPFSVVGADLNGDNKADVAVAFSGSPSNGIPGGVAVLIGNGDGTFRAPVDYAVADSGSGVAGSPLSITIGDFNGDGKPDLATANEAVHSMSVLLNNGDGTFRTHVDYDGGGSRTIVTADFDGDGKLDLALAAQGAGISVSFGNGDGTFRVPHLSYGALRNQLAVGDFNKDGKPDLVSAGGGFGDELSVLLNLGGGIFQTYTTYAPGIGAYSLAAADFNGDGKQDLAVANGKVFGCDELGCISPDNTVSIFLGNADGTLQARTDYPTGIHPLSVAVGDFNGDGKPDLVTANGADNTVSVLVGRGDGTFLNHVDFGTGNGATSVVVADFNGDGKLDLAVANALANTVSILLGNGNGTFQSHVDYATGVSPQGVFPVYVASGDLNGDGKPDLVVAFDGDAFNHTATPAGLAVLINKGDGTFQSAVNYSSAGIPLGIAIADINGDGKNDFAVSNGGATCHRSIFGTSCINDASVGILLGKGDGTFQAAVNYDADSTPYGIAVADFNGDGKPDLVTANAGGEGMVSVLYGRGDGTFRPHADFVVGKASLLAVSDFNEDHKPDVASVSPTSPLTVLLNTATAPMFTVSVKQTHGPSGTAGGVVASYPGGIYCGFGGLCSASFTAGTSVNLSVQPASQVRFTGWSGDCTGTGSCVLNMTADHSVTAGFELDLTTVTLTVAKAGNGSGTVQGFGISCGSTCSSDVSLGGTVAVGAQADPGSTFDGWSGGNCSPGIIIIDCILTMNSNITVTATFSRQPGFQLITVTKAGTGSGIVTSSPSGVDCGSTCGAAFASGTKVTLTAAADPIGNIFTGWSGAGCSSTGPCTMMLTSDQKVTATFDLVPDFSLGVTSGPTPNPITAGQSSSFSLGANLFNNFSGSISFACTVQPSPLMAPACSLSPSSLGSAPYVTTGTVTTTAPMAALASPSAGEFLPIYAVWLPISGLVLAGFGLGSQRSRSTRPFGVLFRCFLLLTGLIFMAACGGGSYTPPPKRGGTPAGTYNITVTATSGSLQHSTSATLMVR